MSPASTTPDYDPEAESWDARAGERFWPAIPSRARGGVPWRQGRSGGENRAKTIARVSQFTHSQQKATEIPVCVIGPADDLRYSKAEKGGTS